MSILAIGPSVFVILAYAVALSLVIVGILVLRRAWWDRDWRAAVGGVLLVVAPVVLVGLRAGLEPTEWNPAVPQGALVGTWVYGHSTLELTRDGRYRANMHAAADSRVHLGRSQGRWRLEDWNLTMEPDSGPTRELRVVVGGGTYRIIEQPGDLDGWRPWFGFQRYPASRVSPEQPRTALRRDRPAH